MLAGRVLVIDQRLDVGGLFDLRALVVTARVTREHRRAVDDAHLMGIGEHRQNAPDMRVRDRIIVQIEADIRASCRPRPRPARATAPDCPAARAVAVASSAKTSRTVRSGSSGTAPVGGRANAPGIGLGIEIVEIGEGAGREERVTYVTYGSLHAAFLVAARDRHGPRFVTIMSGEAQQRGMEADRVAASFQHHALQIVVEQDTRIHPCQAVKAATWPRRKFSIRASRKKRRKICREWLSTMTKAISGRRARPISRCPK